MPSPRSILLTSLLLAVSACAEGGDGGRRTEVDSGTEENDADGGAIECPDGQHRCGDGCIEDLANLPENGCRFGCGEACAAPPDSVAGCSTEGECTVGCEPPFREMDGSCVCTPRTCEDMGYVCGAPDDGCGTPIDCGTCEGDGECMEGVCGCPEDDAEPNDNRLTAAELGALTDSPDSEETYDGFSIHGADDEDWFTFDVADEFDAGDPEIEVTLRNIPDGSDYDLSAYYVCDGNGTGCTVGSADNMVGRGCSSSSSGTSPETVGLDTECGGTDDSGTLHVRVSAPTWGGSCGAYELTVHVH